LLLCARGETYQQAPVERSKDLLIAGIALCYALWLLYAGGLKYLLLSALLYAPGVILFAKARQEQGMPLFTVIEKGIFTVVIGGAGLAAYGLYSDLLSL
jgi:arginine:ornithine antiporter/lysine permease